MYFMNEQFKYYFKNYTQNIFRQKNWRKLAESQNFQKQKIKAYNLKSLKLQTFKLEPLVRLERTTYWLQVSCSTNWAKMANMHFALPTFTPFSKICDFGASRYKLSVTHFVRTANLNWAKMANWWPLRESNPCLRRERAMS